MIIVNYIWRYGLLLSDWKRWTAPLMRISWFYFIFIFFLFFAWFLYIYDHPLDRHGTIATFFFPSKATSYVQSFGYFSGGGIPSSLVDKMRLLLIPDCLNGYFFFLGWLRRSWLTEGKTGSICNGTGLLQSIVTLVALVSYLCWFILNWLGYIGFCFGF